MPRPKKDGAAGKEAKKRSRTGCWQCKARKIKCGEEKPSCQNCWKNGESQACDYRIRLNWNGRRKDNADFVAFSTPSPTRSPHSHVFSAQHITSASPRLERPTTYHSPSLSEPSPATSPALGEDFHWHSQHAAKRVKISSPAPESSSRSSAVFAVPRHITHNGQSSSRPPTSNVPSSENPELRRMSVKSLLSEPLDETTSTVFTPSLAEVQDGCRIWGYDHGYVDFDIPRNCDDNVIMPTSTSYQRPTPLVPDGSPLSGDFGQGELAFEPEGYYASPVAIKIPIFFEPLPPELLNNQMNLLYFHHFINNTGRTMLPHDCEQNPFRTVFPQMAVGNTQLLHLMLTFSASHRARLLGHPEPVNRIAEWMSDVLPALRAALADPISPGAGDPGDPSSLAPIATAIMLASLEISSPTTFSVSIRWQDHLQVARQMIVAQGGLHHLAEKSNGAKDTAIFFLSRWFAYLDVLGGLSGSNHEAMYESYWEDGGGLWLFNRTVDVVDQIDCFYGFSGRCISLLSQVAELATQCDQQRIDPITNRIRAGWRPHETIRLQAVDLQSRLRQFADAVYEPCTHRSPRDDTPMFLREQDNEEIIATNKAFHLAAIIHLQRRVMGLPSVHPDVQDSVQEVIQCLDNIRQGGLAETWLLFPMFTAGCEAQTDETRAVFMGRLQNVRGWGMHSIARARILMQKSWDTGLAWELLADGECLA